MSCLQALQKLQSEIDIGKQYEQKMKDLQAKIQRINQDLNWFEKDRRFQRQIRNRRKFQAQIDSLKKEADL